MDWRFATCPTRRSPDFVIPTTDGVVRAPSWLGMTADSPPCITATTEFVVPRSIPMILLIAATPPHVPRRICAFISANDCLAFTPMCILHIEHPVVKFVECVYSFVYTALSAVFGKVPKKINRHMLEKYGSPRRLSRTKIILLASESQYTKYTHGCCLATTGLIWGIRCARIALECPIDLHCDGRKP